MCSDGMSGRAYSTRSPMRIPSHVAYTAQLAATGGGLTTYEELLSNHQQYLRPPLPGSWPGTGVMLG